MNSWQYILPCPILLSLLYLAPRTGLHDPATSLREEDILRIRRTTLDDVEEWQALPL
jgi:hypothetical protein